jgi:IS1 family transposase
MNRLSTEDRVRIIAALVEGNSIRAVSRMTGASKNTIVKLLMDAGSACAVYQDRMLQNLKLKRIQVDEIWSFIAAKDKNVPENKKGQFGVGSVWTWTALDADTKLVASWMVGPRDGAAATEFMQDLAGRLATRVQLTSDGLKLYVNAVEDAFGSNIDYGMLIKIYGEDMSEEKRYSPAECIGCKRETVTGNPDKKHISTSYVERQNLTMRMHMRRFTRLTNAFSKKLENHIAAISLHFMYYNFCRTHQTLRMTPAMAAGVVSSPMEVVDIVRILDEYEVELKAARKARRAEEFEWYGEAKGHDGRPGRS